MKKFILLSIITSLILSIVGCGDNSNSEIESSINNPDSDVISTEDESSDIEIETTAAIETDSDETDENDESESDCFEIIDYRIENDYYEHGAKITFTIKNVSDEELTFEYAELILVKEDEVLVPNGVSNGRVKLKPNQSTEVYGLIDYPENYVRYEIENYYYSTDSDYIEGHFSEKYVIDLNETTTNVEETVVEDTSNTKNSDTQKYYDIAVNLTKDDCTVDSLGSLKYGDIVLNSQYTGLDSMFSDGENIERSCIYLTLQGCLTFFSMGNSWQTYMPYIMSDVPKSKEECADYVNEFLTWMTDSWFAPSCFEKFNTLSCVEISEKDNVYICNISDIAKCAKELNISEEMLGYIIAALEDSGTTTRFNGNHCEIEYSDYDKKINLS